MWNLEDVDETHRWNIDCVEHRRSHGLVDLMWTWTSKMWMACGHGHRGCAQWMECGHRGCETVAARQGPWRPWLRDRDRGCDLKTAETVAARQGPWTRDLGCGLSPRPRSWAAASHRACRERLQEYTIAAYYSILSILRIL